MMLSAVGVFQQIFYKLSDRNEKIFYKLKQINKTSDVFTQKIYQLCMSYTQQNY